MQGEKTIATEHVENNKGIRKILMERGVKPKHLPPAEDVQRIKRKLNSDEKKALKNPREKKKK